MIFVGFSAGVLIGACLIIIILILRGIGLP
jgi:hypothetical protein